MLIEKIIFNVLAFSMLVYIVLNMIRKNDMSYVIILVIEIIGIIMNFLEIMFFMFTSITSKIVMYLLAVIIPLTIKIIEENKGINFLEIKNNFLARILIILNKWENAKKILNKSIEKYDKNVTSHKLLAKIYEKLGEKQEAIDEYVSIVDVIKNDYNSYYKIGNLLYMQGKKNEAKTMLSNLLNANAEYLKARMLLGKILFEQEEYKEAINIYYAGLRYHQEKFELYYELGINYTMLNDFQTAKAYYEKAAELNHLLYAGYYNLGQIELLEHEYEKAEEFFTKVLEDEGELEPRAYFKLAKIYMLRGEKEKAIIFINKAVNLDKAIIEKVDEEPIFSMIRKYIDVPIQLEEIEEELEEHEKLAIEQLETTCEIVERISGTYKKKNHKERKKEKEKGEQS